MYNLNNYQSRSSKVKKKDVLQTYRAFEHQQNGS